MPVERRKPLAAKVGILGVEFDVYRTQFSISPFADVEASAQRLSGNYIFSWKPHPAHLVGGFDEPLIRNYIRHTVEVAQEHGCVLEMILKDTYTCERLPERFDRWTQIAREEVDRVSM
jgi:hypothetical protein